MFLYDEFAHLLDHVRRSQAGRIIVKVGIVRLKYRQPNICLRTNQEIPSALDHLHTLAPHMACVVCMMSFLG